MARVIYCQVLLVYIFIHLISLTFGRQNLEVDNKKAVDKFCLGNCEREVQQRCVT